MALRSTHDDAKLQSPYYEQWKYDSPISKSLKYSQIHPDSPAALPSNIWLPKQIRHFEGAVRSKSEIPDALQDRKQFYAALRYGFEHSLALNSRTVSTSNSLNFPLPLQTDSPKAVLVNRQTKRATEKPTHPSIKQNSRYKPYSISDYKSLVVPVQRGLGPSAVGTSEWKLRKAKMERVRMYSVNLKLSRN